MRLPVADYLGYVRDFVRFSGMSRGSGRGLGVSWGDRFPRLRDKTAGTSFDRHYVYHTSWAARAVAEIRPKAHVDIGSSLYFSALVSAFVPVRFHDYRPADLMLSGLTSGSADLAGLPFGDGSVESLSCMHVVEHVGLGRYGDPLDPDGDLKAVAELKRVLAVGGTLLFVVPVGRPRIMFNAHRIYSYGQVAGYFEGLELVEFALVPDDPADGGIIVGATGEMADRQEYGCGCFRFRRNEP